jgi:tetratricopeptide (TPR) repeat protein
MLATIRAYALGQLEAQGNGAVLRERHLRYFLALAETAEPAFYGPEQRVWLARMERERENLWSALVYCVERGDAAAGLRLAGALRHFWFLSGQYAEGLRWLERMLDLSAGVTDDAGLTLARAKALEGAGYLAYRQGAYGAAVAHDEAALTLYRALGHREGTATVLNNLGLVVQDQGDYLRATALHEEALALRRGLGNTRGIGASLNNLANLALHQGDNPRAARLYAESLPLFRAVGDTWAVATVLGNYGAVVSRMGDYARATALVEESLALRRALGESHGIAMALNNLGNVARLLGEHGRAEALLRESLALYHQVGDLGSLPGVLEELAMVAQRRGEPITAARFWGAALALRRKLDTPVPDADRGEYDEEQAAIQAALGAEAFAQHTAEGGLLPIKRVVHELAGVGGAVRVSPLRP